MKNQLERQKIEYLDFHEFIDSKKIANIYYKHVEDIKEKINATNVIENKKDDREGI